MNDTVPIAGAQPVPPAVPFSFLLAAQFLVAAAGLVVEIVAGRMLAPYVGMSLYTWTAVIAVVLAGFSAGHWVGGLVADRPARSGLGWLAISGALGALATIAALPLLRHLSGPVLSALTDPISGIVALTGLLFFLPSFAAGIPSPILARLAIEGREQSGRALGALHAISAIGAIAGTLAAGYVFISWLGTAWTLIAVAGAYACFALACLWMARRTPANGGPTNDGGAVLRAGTTATLLSILAVAAGPTVTASACKVESRYYCIRSLDVSADFGAPTRLMVLDHLGHGINVLDDPARLEMPYAAIIDAVTRARLGGLPEHAYFIGGGSLTLPRAWTEDIPRPGIIVAEIDPQVTRIAESDFGVDPTRFTVRHGDARTLLKEHAGLQLVIGDAFTDIAVPAHLVTREFYANIRSALAPDGFYAMNLIDHMDRLRALAATVRTLREVFDAVEVWVEAEDFTAGGRTTFVLVAGRDPTPQARFVLPPSAPGKAARILGRMPAARIDALVATLDPPVLTDDYVPIDRLMGPKP